MNNSLKEAIEFWKKLAYGTDDPDFYNKENKSHLQILLSTCQRVLDGDLILRGKLEDLRDKLEAENFKTMTEFMELKKRVLDAGKEIKKKEQNLAAGINYVEGFNHCHDLFTALIAKEYGGKLQPNWQKDEEGKWRHVIIAGEGVYLDGKMIAISTASAEKERERWHRAGWDDCKAEHEKVLGGLEKIITDIFREYFVPSYPKDKPLNEMTTYEQKMLKQYVPITSNITNAICKAFQGKR